MQKGRIVYLSGLTSTGKSSIVKALQSRTDCLWCALGFDLFEETLPVWAADDSALYARAIRAMYAAAKSFSDQGLDVLIDGLLMDQPGLAPHGSAVEDISARTPEQCAQALLDALRQQHMT